MSDAPFKEEINTSSRDKITISILPKNAFFELPRVVLDTHQDGVLVLSLREVVELARTLANAVDTAIEMADK